MTEWLGHGMRQEKNSRQTAKVHSFVSITHSRERCMLQKQQLNLKEKTTTTTT